jgi:hypothetical protein
MNKVYMLMEGTEYHTPRARSVHSTLEGATKWCYRRYSFMMIEEIELDP